MNKLINGGNSMEKIAKTRYMKWLDDSFENAGIRELSKRKNLIAEKRYGDNAKADVMKKLNLHDGEHRKKFKKLMGAGRTPERAAMFAQIKRDDKVTLMKAHKFREAELKRKQAITDRANDLNETLRNAHDKTKAKWAVQAKNKKIALGLGAGATAIGAGAYGLKKLKDKKQEKTAFEIVNESFEKIADDLETKAWKDRFRPALGRGVLSFGAGIAAGLPTGGLLAAPASLATSTYLKDKKLKQMSKELLGRDATKEERLYNGLVNPGIGTLLSPVSGGASFVASSLNTPESQVKRRARAARDGVQNTKGLYFFNDDSFKREEKKASDIINETFEKIQ